MPWEIVKMTNFMCIIYNDTTRRISLKSQVTELLSARDRLFCDANSRHMTWAASATVRNPQDLLAAPVDYFEMNLNLKE